MIWDIAFVPFRYQYAQWKEECRQMFPIVGSGRFVTAPIITEDGQPVQDPIVLSQINPEKESGLPPKSEVDAVNSELTNGNTVACSTSSSCEVLERVKEPTNRASVDKKEIQWKLTLHQIGWQ